MMHYLNLPLCVSKIFKILFGKSEENATKLRHLSISLTKYTLTAFIIAAGKALTCILGVI